MSDYYTLITNMGAQLLAAAQAAETAVDITHLAVGDGGGVAYNPTGNETELVGQKLSVAINRMYVDPNNPAWVIVEAIIPPEVGGWYIREIGIFDDAGNLIVIGKYPAAYKPVLTEGGATDLVLRVIIQVGSAANVTLTVDPSQVLASQQFVLEAYPWATNAEAQDKAVEGKIIDPMRLHAGIRAALGTLPQAGVMSCLCAVDEAGAIAAGLVDGGFWLDSDMAAPKVYQYDGTVSTEIDPQPNAVWCSNTGKLWVRVGENLTAARPEAKAKVYSAVKTNVFASGSTDWVSVPGLSVSIPNPETGSKFLIMPQVATSGANGVYATHIRLVRNGVPIFVGDPDGIRTSAYAHVEGDNSNIFPVGGAIVDIPGAGASADYEVQIRSNEAHIAYVNRSYSDINNTSHVRAASSLTVLEVV